MVDGLFGEEFEIKVDAPKAKDLVAKIKKTATEEVDVTKVLKSKKITLTERLETIKNEVYRVLGKQKANVLVIRTREQLHDYISNAIAAGRIAIDTETNNSLDPVTCKLMGPCLYYPGGKQSYIPLNHRNPETKERLDWQLTEADIKEEFQRVNDAHIKIIMHNGKFDYSVIKCTCDIEMVPTWDTMVCARLLNENELAGLKWQYTNKIDKSQEKYDIEKLFNNVAYADVDPEVFALYAATDSMMTDKLYELQLNELNKAEYGPHLDITGKHEIKGLRWLFFNVEMPDVKVTADMEMTGVAVDVAYGERLKAKYNAELSDVDAKIDKALSDLKPLIDSWKLLPEANAVTKVYVPKKTKMSQEKIEAQFPEIDEDGNRYKKGKARVEQLEDPINLSSPAQLAILFYDILGVPAVSKKSDRATGKDELKAISEKLAAFATAEAKDIDDSLVDEDIEDINDIEASISVKEAADKQKEYTAAADICKLLLKRRGIMKLITTYIDVIPDLAKHWPDGRIRFHLNQMGTDTGRYSSGGKLKFMENDKAVTVSGINIQNIPSHNPEVRMLFKAETTAKLIEAEDNEPFIIDEISDVEMVNGWVRCKNLNVGDLMLVDGVPTPIKAINYLADLRQYSIEV